MKTENYKGKHLKEYFERMSKLKKLIELYKEENPFFEYNGINENGEYFKCALNGKKIWLAAKKTKYTILSPDSTLLPHKLKGYSTLNLPDNPEQPFHPINIEDVWKCLEQINKITKN